MDKTKANPIGYIYGPVPSRRLGLSLGIDIIPAKVCTLDCIYCQIGRTTEKSTTRRDFFSLSVVLDELKTKLAQGIGADYVTIGGSGEPTLNSQLGALIDGIRKLTDIPVAIITNGTLLYRPDVRAECAKADLVIPSLDAGNARSFEAVNRPAPDISIERLISGLADFRDEFSGQIWLEVFLIEGRNTDPEQIDQISAHIKRIRPDRVQLNSAVRPAAEEGIQAISRERLAAIARKIGDNCEIVGAAPEAPEGLHAERTAQDVLSMLKRRPCSIEDISTGLGLHRHEAVKHIEQLLSQGQIVLERQGTTTYYRSTAS
jgi:wyosine [tRNA(Phe)-imidazoG37] synthetase (radical SAM superfamily)